MECVNEEPGNMKRVDESTLYGLRLGKQRCKNHRMWEKLGMFKRTEFECLSFNVSSWKKNMRPAKLRENFYDTSSNLIGH